MILSMAPNWRQIRRMTALAQHKTDDRSRQSLRLDPEIWALMDRARIRRPGNISRNTWITEAIEEKLAREGTFRSGEGESPHA